MRRAFAMGLLALGVVRCAPQDASPTSGLDGENELGVKSCSVDCVLDIFKDLSKVFRPSYGEEQSRAWVMTQVEEGRRRWRSAAKKDPALDLRQFEVAQDEKLDAQGRTISNILVRLPGTHEFKKHKPIALQAHLDMILAVDGAEPGEPLEPYFENGVDVVQEMAEVDGEVVEVMHSRDYKTTLGADDGVGVANMVRYLLDPGLPHPPLELVFTSVEETGLVGAIHYDAAKLPLRAEALISLDGSCDKSEEHPAFGDGTLGVIVGANGGVIEALYGKVQATPVAPGTIGLQLSLKGLRGGHSGFAIHLKLMNAIKAWGTLSAALLTAEPRARLVEVNVGEVAARKGQNKIASAFTTVLALPAGADVAGLSLLAESTFAAYRGRPEFADENLGAIQLTVSTAPLPEATALSSELTAAFVKAVNDSPNGALAWNDSFPNKVEYSSNLGILGVNGTGDTKDMVVGYMPRAYVLETALATSETLRGLFDAVIRAGGGTSTREQAPFNPWLVPEDSELVQLTMQKTGEPFEYVKILPAGTEPGEFAAKFPQLKGRLEAIVPKITGAHTPKETLGVQSFRDSTKALQSTLVTLAKEASFLQPDGK